MTRCFDRLGLERFFTNRANDILHTVFCAGCIDDHFHRLAVSEGKKLFFNHIITVLAGRFLNPLLRTTRRCCNHGFAIIVPKSIHVRFFITVSTAICTGVERITLLRAGRFDHCGNIIVGESIHIVLRVAVIAAIFAGIGRIALRATGRCRNSGNILVRKLRDILSIIISTGSTSIQVVPRSHAGRTLRCCLCKRAGSMRRVYK